MRVLGFDPGLRVTGYGCVAGDEVRPAIVEAGAVRLVKGSGAVPSVADRLVELDRDIRELIGRLAPDAIAIEGLFAHYKHPETAIKMAHARGLILLAARQAGVEIVELKPAEVKKSLTGSGSAGKAQVQESVRQLFRLEEAPKPNDVADALAIAVAAGRRAAVGLGLGGGVRSGSRGYA